MYTWTLTNTLNTHTHTHTHTKHITSLAAFRAWGLCAHIHYFLKACQAWEVMYIKLSNPPVHLMIFIRCSNSPCYSRVCAGTPKLLTVLPSLHFKPKSVLGCINCSYRVGAENQQVKKSKSCTLWDFLCYPHKTFSLIYSPRQCVVLCLLARRLNSQTHTDIYVHTDTPQANTLRYKQARPEARPHDTPGKGELAVTTERVQISRVDINALFGLCTLLFFPPLSPWWLFHAAQRPAKLPAALIWL